MRRKAPVTFGEGRLEQGRAYDTTWIVPSRSEHNTVPRWPPTLSQMLTVIGETRGRTLENAFHLKGVGLDEPKDPRETGNFTETQ